MGWCWFEEINAVIVIKKLIRFNKPANKKSSNNNTIKIK